MSGGELCLLQHEVDQIELMKDKLMENDIIADLIIGTDGKLNDYEEPNVKMIEGKMWKGKADIVNHNEGLVIDKTTHQIGVFDCSPKFYESGQDKVQRAVEAYELFFATEDFDPKQYFISKTL